MTHVPEYRQNFIYTNFFKLNLRINTHKISFDGEIFKKNCTS